ncbi:hypothetical protein GGQ08_002895 [Salinibacter ruber]|nr:hypothetical protein [Salinibacter ruber]MCS3651253.1 hypothetical protein [Salinibacter ruber]MCS3654819.1 hypothetical protein [Salinibacter ruber]MCS3660265.1 hypothetical protein [Salinibacter ruber]MCS3682753.1 hypothetical protein [Salinibacter ruber]
MLLLAFVPVGSAQAQDHGLWTVYQHPLKGAKYVDRPFAVGPTSPAWPGFNTAGVRAATAGNAIPGSVEKEAYTSGEHGSVATSYVLPTDQYSTQLDPPAHWNERGVLRPAPADSAQSSPRPHKSWCPLRAAAKMPTADVCRPGAAPRTVRSGPRSPHSVRSAPLEAPSLWDPRIEAAQNSPVAWPGRGGAERARTRPAVGGNSTQASSLSPTVP